MALIQFVPEVDFLGTILFKILLAVAIGAILGYERQSHTARKGAGIRTFILITLGAMVYTLTSMYGFGDEKDPSRVAAQIVTGIGFIGAGLIWKEEGSLHGLTTAASIWFAAAAGISVAVGMYLTALLSTLVVYIILRTKMLHYIS